MKPIFFTLGERLPLMIIPDTQAHLNGHTIITHTYSIYLDIDNGNPEQALTKETTLHLERIKDPDYYGYITFEQTGQIFTYTPDGQKNLNDDQIEQIIENVSHVRDNPSIWQHLDDV
jgi:hypothetical protein